MNKICVHCDEEILPHEVLPIDDEHSHHECLMRSITGSIAHQQRKCACFGGDGKDDEKLTVRQNAVAAYKYYLDVQDKKKKAKFN